MIKKITIIILTSIFFIVLIFSINENKKYDNDIEKTVKTPEKIEEISEPVLEKIEEKPTRTKLSLEKVKEKLEKVIIISEPKEVPNKLDKATRLDKLKSNFHRNMYNEFFSDSNFSDENIREMISILDTHIFTGKSNPDAIDNAVNEIIAKEIATDRTEIKEKILNSISNTAKKRTIKEWSSCSKAIIAKINNSCVKEVMKDYLSDIIATSDVHFNVKDNFESYSFLKNRSIKLIIDRCQLSLEKATQIVITLRNRC
jgi:hypothetical protein